MTFVVGLYGNNEEELFSTLKNFEQHMEESVNQIKNLGIDLPSFVILEKYLHVKKTQMIVVYKGGTREMAYRHPKVMLVQKNFLQKDYVKID